ncbi:hypothetical protein [Tenacibaculum finnmarkense]|uniref:hypothetical protein n=2 Tax=Tenacibaculum finnmarkense TaxID=2781243 RepID=UPI001EFB1C9A|nr:hypothetical protein [Tenacibaculum finnmarkense]MCG8237346.1 hypothetical protein [Tenacibaculum finnmarkense genomovar ulcerans]MCG8831443.1 hypothetical protein [Tenacibaculum finnmarkense]
MEHQKDFIEREIQKLTLILTKLISGFSETNLNNFDIGIEEINDVLKSEFDLTIPELSKMTNFTLIKKARGLHKIHIEKLIELLYQIIKKNKSAKTDKVIDENKLIKKTLLLIEYVDKKSNTFSLERLNIKNVLQQNI